MAVDPIPRMNRNYKGQGSSMLINCIDGIGRYSRGQNVKEVTRQGSEERHKLDVNAADFGTDSNSKNGYSHDDEQEEKEDKWENSESGSDKVRLVSSSLKSLRSEIKEPVSSNFFGYQNQLTS